MIYSLVSNPALWQGWEHWPVGAQCQTRTMRWWWSPSCGSLDAMQPMSCVAQTQQLSSNGSLCDIPNQSWSLSSRGYFSHGDGAKMARDVMWVAVEHLGIRFLGQTCLLSSRNCGTQNPMNSFS